jgi:hypothetical protein
MGFFLMFLVYAALFVLTDLLTPKPELENAKPAGIGDFQFPTATEGRVVPLLWGTVRIAGPNVVWWGDLRQIAITEKVKTGLFSSETITKGYKYEVGIQSALCRGPIDELLGVWIGDEKVFTGNVVDGGTFTINEPELFGGDDLGNGGVVGTLRLHAGSLTQTPSTYLSAFQQEGGDTPGYNGTCYIAPNANPVYVGNSTSIKPWKYEVRRIPNGLGLVIGEAELNGGNDCNPMNVIFEAMTDTSWGLGLDPLTIDTADFSTAAGTLAAEGNGFSFLLDRAERAEDLIRRVEEQIDGVIFFNQIAGLWQVNLARADYDILLVPELNDTNILEIRSFTRGTWEGTVNQYRAAFNQRDDDYKDTSGFAQDMANVRIQEGVNVSAGESFPGVKDSTLANAIAWRQLRTLSFPLAQAQIVVDRTFYDVQPSVVYAFTNSDAGFVRLPMRVKSAGLGEIADGKIVLDLVQDVFFSAAGVFGDPGGTGWEPPLDTLVPFPVDQQEAIEAPRALTFRDPLGSGPDVDKIYAWARKQGVEVTFKIVERHAAGVPAGAFLEVGEVFQFALLGELVSALPRGSAFPQTSVTIIPTPNSQAELLAALPSSPTDPVDLGTDLLTLIAIDNEFMLVSDAQTSGANVQLNDVYRGVLDTVMEDHAANADVWLVFVGAGISDSSIPAGDNVDVKLLPRSATDEVAEASATAIAFQMDNRVRRPYPPSELSLGGTRFATTISLEDTGTGESDGIDLTFARRDFRTAEGGDEIAALGVDAPTLFPTFPTANNTTHEVEVIDDPDGTPTSLFTQDLALLAQGTVRRVEILRWTDGVLPLRMQFRLRSTHDYQSVSRDSLVDLTWDFNVTSALTGLFNFGARAANLDSLDFTVAQDTVDHDFTLSSAFVTGPTPIGDVEYRINGGGWLQLIAQGGTTGSIPNASITNGDTIEIRHRGTDAGAIKLIEMDVGATPTAYGILYV